MDIVGLGLAALAGVLTMLSPCVIPLLPLVLGGAASEHKFGPVALAGGLAISFTIIGLFVATIGFGIGLDTEFFRAVAAILLVTVGLILTVPMLQARLAVVAKGGLADRFAVGASVDADNPAYLALLAALAVGMAGGGLQGLAITRLRVPPFVVTLGGLTAFRGATLLLSGGGPISGFAPDYTWWGQGRVYGVPVPVIIFACAAIIAHIVLRYSRFGLHVYATGGNPVAANLNGVPTARTTLLVYVITGFFCGLAAFLLSARLSSAEAVAGDGLELIVIASVVIGGTSLFGGIGNIAGTVVGTLLIGVLRNGLVLLNVSSFIQQIVIGLVLVAAVAFDQFATSGRQQFRGM